MENGEKDDVYKNIESAIEYEIKKHILPQAELISSVDKKYVQSVMLPISGRCNLSCSYCFAQTKNGFGFSDMNEEETKNIVDFIMENSSNEVACHINFFGGEPLLNFKMINLAIDYISENYKERKISYGITTNGTILSQSMLSYLKMNKVGILLSIDGPENLSYHRKYKNGKSSYNTVIKNMSLLDKYNYAYQLRATISSDCEDIVGIYRFFENMNKPFAAVIAYKSINETDLCKYESKINVFKKQYCDLLQYYTERVKTGNKINCFSIINDIFTIKNQIKRKVMCTGGINFFAIVNDGDIFACEHLVYNKNYAVGNIKTGIIKEMSAPPVESIEKCKKCWIRYLCCGGCFSSNMSVGKNHLEDDECEMKRIYWDFILSLYLELNNYGYFKMNKK